MKERSYKTIESVQDFLANLPSLQEHSDLIYRGHERASYKLIPSLYRQPSYPRERDAYIKIVDEALESLEQHSVINSDWHNFDDFKKSAIAQHYGIPTPILDWTTDPKIALFFASLDIVSKEEGEVIVLYGKPQALEGEGYNVDGVFPYLRIPEHCNRHVAQKGLFTYHPFFDDDSLVSIDDIIVYVDQMFYEFRYRIPHEMRNNIQNELNDLNINFESIYPDHEGVAKHATWKINHCL